MKLKRNILTILYAALFLLIMGLALFQMFYLTFVTSSANYMVAGIVVLGIIIYLILAFLIREKGCIQKLEENRVLPVFLECVVTIACVGIVFVVRYENGLQTAILHSVLLFILGIVGRFLFGRVNGIVTTILAFFLVFFNGISLNANSIIQLLAFLVPYAMYLCVSRYITQNGVFVVLSYVILGFMYAIAITVNPLVLLLFAGCVLSLLFGKAEGKNSVLAKGVVCAGFLVLFTGILLCVAYFMIPNMITIPELQIDSQIPFSKFDASFVFYFMAKLLKTVKYIIQSYSNGMVSVVMLFFAVLPGYYCISKKASYIGPMLFTFLGLLGYYLVFSEEGSVFYYFTYFLPILAGYGFSNTLISDCSQEDENKEDENKEDENKEDENKEDVEKKDADKKDKKKKDKKKKEESPKTSKGSAENLTRSRDDFGVSPKSGDDIPEWTIGEGYSEPQKEEINDGEESFEQVESLIEERVEVPIEELVEEAMELTEEPTELTEEAMELTEEPIENFVEESTEGALLANELVSDELEIDGFSLEPELLQDEDEEANLSYVDTEEDSSSFIQSSATVLENNTDITELTHDGSNDYEQFISEEEGMPLDELLERLDISDNIKRMNEGAQEDMADVIERDEEQVELDEALPLKPSKSTLPKYKKPNFDFELEPVSIPLDDSYSNISEYDEVPTVHDLESKWKSKDNTVIETVATPIEEESDSWKEKELLSSNASSILDIHSDEIVKKSGTGKRSYHRITIR